MAARAICDADADYSFLDKQCSSAINCCSSDVGYSATRLTGPGPAYMRAELISGGKAPKSSTGHRP